MCVLHQRNSTHIFINLLVCHMLIYLLRTSSWVWELGICLLFSFSIILFGYAFQNFQIFCWSSHFHLLLYCVLVHCSVFISTRVVSSLGQQPPGGILCLSSAYPCGLLVQDWFLSTKVLQIIILNWVWVAHIHITCMSYVTFSRCYKYWPWYPAQICLN